MSMRDLTGRKRAESPRDAARDTLARQNDALLKINHFSIELSTLSPQDNLEAFITKRIKEIAGAVAAIFSEYNPENRTTTVRHIDMEPRLLGKVVGLLGRQMEKIRSPVSEDMYREITTEIVGMRRTLYEASFGAVSRPVGAAIQTLLKVDRFIGIAYLIEGKLYGTSLLAMSKGQPDPSKQILENFSFLAALSLRRKQAESQRAAALEALQINLEKYRVLFELFPLGITISDKAGKIIEANRQSEQLLGITSEAQSQRKIDSKEWQIIRKDGTPMPADEYASTRALRENRLIEDVEMGIVKDKGEITWINVTAAPISLEGYGVAIAYGDITERKLAEEALRESEVRYRELFENIHSGVAVYTVIGNGQDFIFKDLNPAGERIDRDRRERLIGKSIREVRPGIENFGLIEVFRQVWQTGKPAYHPVSLYQDEKLSGWYENFVYKLPSGEIVAVFNDITERKRVEETLRSSEGLLQKIYDILPVGLWFADKDGKLLRGNPIGVKIWGAEPKVDPSEYGVFKARRLPSGEEVAPDDWALAHTIRDKVTIIDELLEIDAFDGKKKTILNYTAPVLDAKGDVQGAIVVNQDITERKKAEEALRNSESNLRALAIELSRVEEGERQRLALFLHDEIGQSLALLRMMFGGLAQTSNLKSEKLPIRRIRHLLKKVIEQTHTLTFELSPPVLHQLGLEAAIEWAGDKIGHDHRIEFIFNDDGTMKPLDADLKAFLFRCVRELMMNIVKHAKARKMTVSLKTAQNQLTVIVEDNGIGFDTSLLERQLDMVGFGLFSIRERLAAIGGTFDPWSEPGRGTRITLSVSLKDEWPPSSTS